MTAKHAVRAAVNVCVMTAKGLQGGRSMALVEMAKFADANPPDTPIHAATLLKNKPGSRDHGVAPLRHWGFILPVPRPKGAKVSQKGSRGLSGFYIISAEGWRVLQNENNKFHKNIAKPFGSDVWTPCGPMTTLSEVYDSATLNTDAKERVIDGTTSITGIKEPKQNGAVAKLELEDTVD